MSNLQYVYTSTRDVHIRSYSKKDAAALFHISSNPKTIHLWAPNAEKLSANKFTKMLERSIAHRWDHFRVIERLRDHRVLGFSYCYNSSKQNSTAYLCICIDKPHMNSLICLRASYLYFSHLFIDQKYRKLYTEVFQYNQQCVNLLKKLGFDCEGCLKQHQSWADDYWDLYIFSLSKVQYEQLCLSKFAIVERLT